MVNDPAQGHWSFRRRLGIYCRNLAYLPAKAGRNGHHLIRSDLQSRPLPAHSGVDLVKYSSAMRSERQP